MTKDHLVKSSTVSQDLIYRHRRQSDHRRRPQVLREPSFDRRDRVDRLYFLSIVSVIFSNKLVCFRSIVVPFCWLVRIVRLWGPLQ